MLNSSANVSFEISENDTVTNPESTPYRLIINSLYLSFGLFGLLCNGLVLASLFPAKQIHGILISGLASADFVNAAGYFCFGIRALILSKMEPFLMSPSECILKGVHISFFEIGESAGSMMTMFISLDRLFAMVFLVRYRNFSKRYAYLLIAVSVGYTAVDVITSWIGATLMDQERKNYARCSHSPNVPSLYYSWHTWHVIVCGYISIVFYIIAFGALKFWNKSSTVNANQLKREARVTKRLASIVLMTFFLQIVTVTVNITSEGNSFFVDNIVPYMWSLYALIPSVNVLVYSITNSDFRDFVKVIVGWKKHQLGGTTTV